MEGSLKVVYAVFVATWAVFLSYSSEDGGVSERQERVERFVQRGFLPQYNSSGSARSHREVIRVGGPSVGIRVGEALDPPLCPPPPLTRSLGICFLQKCSSDQECSRSSACCFNGCIHTCMEPMDRPAAFDWIEDTSKILPILGAEFEEPSQPFEEPSQPFFPIPLQKHPPEFEAAVGGEELVHLPGGCFISASKYEKLKEFMKTPSIKECRCDDGEVVCDIRTRDAQ